MPRLNKPHKEKTQSALLLPDISPLIWIHGPGPGSRGSVLVILAQNGYTREARTVIGLSKTASLIGRDSDGGLPVLWDVMGKVRRKNGLTRLMAICATHGSLSPQRALALIRDHNVDVRARDDEGRTALHYALNGCTFSDPWPKNNPINTELIRVLIEACPELVKLRDGKKRLPLYYACREYAPFDVIKLLLYIHPEGLQYVPFETLPPSTLVALAKEKVVKENGVAAGDVASALSFFAVSESGCQICINAGATLALTELARQNAVKEDSDAAWYAAYALRNIAASESGRQSCINAGAPLALTELARQKAVKENGNAAGNVASALGNIAKSESGRQSCINAGATLALTELARQKAVKENGNAAGNVARALGNIAECETGIQSCINAGAPLALTELARQKAVKVNSDAAGDVAIALGNIAASDTGCQSCIDAGAPLALTELATQNAVKENGSAARYVAIALGNIAKSDTGRQSCTAAGAPLALTGLARLKAVKEDTNAAVKDIANAYKIITGKDLK